MPRFHVTHRSDGKFERRGLRSYFEYRDLGIKRDEGHYHDVNVQFVYVLKGWILFEYEGVGEVMMKAGSCFYQPPNIRHRELKHSKNVEMIEIVGPASFKTYAAAPAARKSPVRRSRG